MFLLGLPDFTNFFEKEKMGIIHSRPNSPTPSELHQEIQEIRKIVDDLKKEQERLRKIVEESKPSKESKTRKSKDKLVKKYGANDMILSQSPYKEAPLIKSPSIYVPQNMDVSALNKYLEDLKVLLLSQADTHNDIHHSQTATEPTN